MEPSATTSPNDPSSYRDTIIDRIARGQITAPEDIAKRDFKARVRRPDLMRSRLSLFRDSIGWFGT